VPEAAELIAFTLSAGEGGSRAVSDAHALLKRFGGLRGLFKATAADLRAAGLDTKQAARIRSAGELCQLWSQQHGARGKAFGSSKDFYQHFHLRLRDLKKERFYTVSLDQKHRLLGEELVSEGTLTEALVHPREVFAPALELRAAAVVVLHNHPSGDPQPSKADRALTERLQEASNLIGIRLLDHLVIGDGKFFSFADEGLL
jgi:DNA repair protein RadC